MASQWIMFVSVQFLLTNNIHSQTCSKIESFVSGRTTAYSIKYYCCANAIEKNGRCETCPIGYASENNHCQQCKEDFYGERCAFDCFCEANESCDHVYGCINSTTSTQQSSKPTIAPIKERDSSKSTSSSNYVVLYMSSIATIGSTVIIAIALWRQKDWIKKRLNGRTLRFPRLQEKSSAEEKLKEVAFFRKSENVYDDINERYMLKDFEKLDFIQHEIIYVK
ncbi:uncharacterized protein LOC127714726 [Mytilus californianus]|uniref:uncharacterized protein LOC127714726 n=1 Tax=Mytilus californianus TaxID=6549 RepID=UPI00224641E3|nr:uncharacterized protein LOC127714726 [Mytilus californianus]